MTQSIRLRIGLAVLVVAVVLLSIQMAFVLARVRSLTYAEVDTSLQAELAEIEAFLDTPQLQTFVDVEATRRITWDEFFIEVRDAKNRLVARTENVPADGLPAQIRPSQDGGVLFWDAVNPRSRKGHRKIRIAETRMGEFRVRVAQSLRLQEKRYWSLRRQMAWALLLISTLGAAAAHLVATRALSPLRQIMERARTLEAITQGELPRTESGDELDQLASILNDLLRRIRAEVARIRRMTADVAHALRTPLTVIRGTLELQLDRALPDSTEQISNVLEEVDQLIRAVNELLFLEKLEASPVVSETLGSVDIGDLTQDLVQHLRILAEDGGIKLHCTAEAAFTRADPAHIRRGIANLIDNALRHTPESGSVDVTVRVVEDRVEVAVCDSGPGLAGDQLECIFERFYSVPGSGSGIGLGLPIARAIARAYGGDVYASSPGGARFVLSLPVDSHD